MLLIYFVAAHLDRQETLLYGKTKLKNDTTISIMVGNLLQTATDAIIISIASSLQRVGICGSAYQKGNYFTLNLKQISLYIYSWKNVSPCREGPRQDYSWEWFTC